MLVLPITLLLAMLYALTNHTRCNELTAMRAAGISLWRICAPYFVAGCVLSVVLFGLNELLVPRSLAWAQHIRTRHVPDPDNPITKTKINDFAFFNTRSHRMWKMSEYVLKTHEMLKPIVRWTLPDGSSLELHADRAIRTNGVWTFFNVAEFSQAGVHASPVPGLATNELAMPEFDETPGQIQSEIIIGNYQSYRKSNRPEIPLTDILAYLRLHPERSHKDSSWLFTELQRRIALPWTCLVVVLVAIPFGAASGRRNLFVGVAGSIFICFTYFVIQQITIQMGSHDSMAPWLAAWLPNIIFAAMGLALMVRVR